MAGLRIDTPTGVIEINASFQYPELAKLAFEGAYYTALEAADHFDTPGDVIALSAKIHEFAEKCISQAQEILLTEEMHPIACSAGCAHCCNHLLVSCDAPEVFEIIDFLESSQSPFNMDEVKDKVRTFNRHRGDHPYFNLHRETGQGLACPFLVDAKCAIYPVRPTMCRGYNSYFVEQCRAYRENPLSDLKVQLFAPQYDMARVITTALRTAMTAKGYSQDRSVELFAALEIALNTPSAAKSWLDKTRIFHHSELQIGDNKVARL